MKNGQHGRWLAVTLVLTLGGCASSPGPRIDARPPQALQQQDADTEASSPRIALQIRRVQPLPAARALLDQSQRALVTGDLNRAWQLAERAQRISPQAAEVYLQMARIRLREGRDAQARQLLGKARALAGQDAQLLQRIRQTAQGASG